MVKETEIVFTLLRGALEGEVPEVGEMNAQHWWSLFRLLQRNHVAALTAEVAATLEMPREVKIPWLSERDKAVRWYRFQEEVQQDILSRMEQHRISTLVLKGTHLAQYYPQPELREFGDLDLYFYDRHDEADEVARREMGVTVNNDSHHHTKYDYRGVTVESHYDFLNIHYPPSNRRYEQLLEKTAPSPTFEVLFLLRHMACHFAASRLTLRDLCDWTLTSRALKDQVDWPLVSRTIENYGMKHFASALNALAGRRLGFTSPIDPTPLSDTDIRVEHDIVYGTVNDHSSDGLGRLGWKLRRWRALAWKRRMVFSDSEARLFLASFSSHAEKPQSILHKQ